MGRNREANENSYLTVERLQEQIAEQARMEVERAKARTSLLVEEATKIYKASASLELPPRPKNEMVSVFPYGLMRATVFKDAGSMIDMQASRLLGVEELVGVFHLPAREPKSDADEWEKAARGPGLEVSLRIIGVSIVEEIHSTKTRAEATGAFAEDIHRVVYAKNDIHANRKLEPGEVVFLASMANRVDGEAVGVCIVPALCADFSSKHERARFLDAIETEKRIMVETRAAERKTKTEDNRRSHGETRTRLSRRRDRKNWKKQGS